MRLHHHRRQCLGPVCICHPPLLRCVILPFVAAEAAWHDEPQFVAAFDAEVITLADPAAAAAAAVVVVAVAAYVFVASAAAAAAVVGVVAAGVAAVPPAPVEPFPAPRAGVVPGDAVQTHYH